MNQKGLRQDRSIHQILTKGIPDNTGWVRILRYYEGRRILEVSVVYKGELYRATNWSGTITPEELLNRFTERLRLWIMQSP